MKTIKLLFSQVKLLILQIRQYIVYKRIHFTYINHKYINYKKDECCCICIHRLEVHKHCYHSISKHTCICNESLNFYVCDVFIDHEDNNREINLCGEHGICERFNSINS